MINFNESNILQLLPSILGNTPEVQAISYALSKQVNKLNNYFDKSLTWSAIENLDSKMLDILAIELRTHYYDESLDIETKKKLVKGTIERYKLAGTRAAVEELISLVFGNGQIEEWFEYGGKPHYFRIKTVNPITIGAQAEEFLRLLEVIKRKSSHLDSINIEEMNNKQIYVGVISREIDVRIQKLVVS